MAQTVQPITEQAALFPAGTMQGYLNLKGYKEFAAENQPEGWNAWLTFSISPRRGSAAAAIDDDSQVMARKGL